MTGQKPLAPAMVPAVAPFADPAARPPSRNPGAWRIWLGWAAAASLHGALLAALICSWPLRLNPAPPNPAAVSLLIVSEKPALQFAVQPKPPAAPAATPAMPSLIAANGPMPAKPMPAKPMPAEPKPSPSTSPAAPPHASPTKPAATALPGAVGVKTVPQQLGGGFVAAQPLAGSANQPPEYPPAAYVHGEQGSVLLSIHVLPNGMADSVSVTQSSGYRILDDAAAQAVWKWRFQPSTLAGQPVPSVIPYKIKFNLQDAP